MTGHVLDAKRVANGGGWRCRVGWHSWRTAYFTESEDRGHYYVHRASIKAKACRYCPRVVLP